MPLPLQNIEFGNPSRRFPLALLPISKSNDVSRAVGWGSVYKQDFREEHVVPDLLSAIAAAPPVKVDCWNVRIMTSDKRALGDAVTSFRTTKDVRSSPPPTPHCVPHRLQCSAGLLPFGARVALVLKRSAPGGVVSMCWQHTRARLHLQARENYAWNSIYFALDNETANGLKRLAAPASKHSSSERHRHRGRFLDRFGCLACGSDGASQVPVRVQLSILTVQDEWKSVDLPNNLVAIMVENLPKRWAGGDDFWDNAESGVRCAARIRA